MKESIKTILYVLGVIITSCFIVACSDPMQGGESQIVNASFAMQMLAIVVAVVFVVGPITISRLDEMAEVVSKKISSENNEIVNMSLLSAKKEIKENTYALYIAFIVTFATCLFSELNIPFMSCSLIGLKNYIFSVILLSCMIVALISAFDLIRALFRILAPNEHTKKK